MAYSELIKNFDRIRDYMRQFYVYGFKRRSDYTDKSTRSYDNERRRIESWLGDYMKFRHTADGKSTFLSVDSRATPHNPLYKAFKAKSFTSGDITFHFYILDLLHGGKAYTAQEIIERFSEKYVSHFENGQEPNLSITRKKLQEYVSLGILKCEKRGRELVFSRSESSIDLESWADTIAFFSEADPMGVVGSFLLDQLDRHPDYFQFKHHYIFHALDSQILLQVLFAISEQRSISLTNAGMRRKYPTAHTVLPMKIYISTQGGRQYLLCYHYRFRKLMFFRLDHIRSVEPGEKEPDYPKYEGFVQKFQTHLWGISEGIEFNTDHLELTISYAANEGYILRRLEREKRNGVVEILDDHTCRYSVDVYDALELLPWIRTFIGRIVELKCSDPAVTDRFYADLEKLASQYGGDG